MWKFKNIFKRSFDNIIDRIYLEDVNEAIQKLTPSLLCRYRVHRKYIEHPTYHYSTYIVWDTLLKKELGEDDTINVISKMCVSMNNDFTLYHETLLEIITQQ